MRNIGNYIPIRININNCSFYNVTFGCSSKKLTLSNSLYLFANKMTYIKRVRKSLKDIDINKSLIENESQALKKQFADLKVDIKNGRFTAEQVQQYTGEERQAFDNFQLSFKGIYLNHKEQKMNFYYAQPTITEYIELMKLSVDQN